MVWNLAASNLREAAAALQSGRGFPSQHPAAPSFAPIASGDQKQAASVC